MTSLNGIYYKLKALLNTSLYNTVCKSEQRQACVRIHKEWKHVRRFFIEFPVCLGKLGVLDINVLYMCSYE